MPLRLLFVTPTPPTRTKPRPHHLMRSLVARGHEVHLSFAASSPQELEQLEGDPGWRELVAGLASTTATLSPTSAAYRRCLVSLPSPTPLRIAYCEHPPFIERSLQLARQLAVDVMHVDRERLGRAFKSYAGPKVLDATDSIAIYNAMLARHGHGLDRVLAMVDGPKMARYERGMADGYDACLLSAADDADAVRTAAPDAPIEVVPNGVDERFLSAVRRPDPDSIAFVGTMYYPPNVDGARWFVHEILPRISARRPKARVALVGADPSSSVRALATVPRVEVTGRVPDVLPYLEQAAVFVSPIRIGGGFPNKLVEAFAAGVPTVTTSAGIAGVARASAGTHALVADDPERFADHVVALLDDEQRGSALAAAARDLAAAEHRWDDVAAIVEGIYERCLATRLR